MNVFDVVSDGFSCCSANSIQLEDQQGRLEQEIRELLIKDGMTLWQASVTQPITIKLAFR